MTRGYEPYHPRRQKERPSAAAVVLLVCLLGAIVSTLLLLSIAKETSKPIADEAPAPPKASKITHDSLAPTYTYDGEIIRTYVFTDPDSGVQYLVTDAGGITPRLGKNGHIIGVQDEAA